MIKLRRFGIIGNLLSTITFLNAPLNRSETLYFWDDFCGVMVSIIGILASIMARKDETNEQLGKIS